MSDPRKEDPQWEAKRDAMLWRSCNGDTAAHAYLLAILEAVEIWDDLIDEDKPVTKQTLNKTFTNLMFWIPQNQFFDRNKTYLSPVVMACINAWLDANELQSSEQIRCRQAAWWLKQMGVELIGVVAFLTGGYEHMRLISLEARHLLMHEDFTDFELENKSCQSD